MRCIQGRQASHVSDEPHDSVGSKVDDGLTPVCAVVHPEIRLLEAEQLAGIAPSRALLDSAVPLPLALGTRAIPNEAFCEMTTLAAFASEVRIESGTHCGLICNQ
jgi:hypothetical protein